MSILLYEPSADRCATWQAYLELPNEERDPIDLEGIVKPLPSDDAYFTVLHCDQRFCGQEDLHDILEQLAGRHVRLLIEVLDD